MKRRINYHLAKWRKNPRRKPLILRGARQVGKTYAVNHLGKQFDNCVEINFELTPAAKALFELDLSPTRILRDLSLLMKQPITPGKTLLFLDEVQEQPQAILALRYFYEQMPELHVIAAGSLLNFAIEKVGIPVGRIEFLYMYPLSFIEFLYATDNQSIAKAILNQEEIHPFTEVIHEKVMMLLGEYFAVGGMPEAVKTWRDTQNINAVLRVQKNIAQGYIQDIPKYAKKSQIEHVDLILKHIPHILGQRFKTTQIAGEYRKRELSPAIDLLEKAMLANRIYHTSAQGLPLAAQSDLEKYKLNLIDIAISQRLLNSDPHEWVLNPKTACINKGPLVEAFVGQEMLAYQDPSDANALFYWHREERGSSAEVDYITAINQDIVPIEVKSGKGHRIKSLRLFLESHPHSSYGVRFSANNYSVIDSLYSYPLYAIIALFQKYHNKNDSADQLEKEFDETDNQSV